MVTVSFTELAVLVFVSIFTNLSTLTPGTCSKLDDVQEGLLLDVQHWVSKFSGIIRDPGTNIDSQALSRM